MNVAGMWLESFSLGYSIKVDALASVCSHCYSNHQKRTNMYASKHLLAACLILALPAALIARPSFLNDATVSQRDRLMRQRLVSNQTQDSKTSLRTRRLFQYVIIMMNILYPKGATVASFDKPGARP